MTIVSDALASTFADWRAKDGEMIPVSELSDGHLQAVINMYMRDSAVIRALWTLRLLSEQQRRASVAARPALPADWGTGNGGTGNA